MTLEFGIHTGPQDLTMAELERLWKRADESGFDWISVWDHFYANPLESRGNPCFEGVATMAALAAMTSRVRVGCLVFCALFRSPGLLAKAATTIDHISGGRAEIGIGAGWFEEEFRDFGYPFPPLGQRLDQLEEALAVVNSLLFGDEPTRHHGSHYRLDGAVCSPAPLNPEMRIWVGGRGKQRTPMLAARHARGFNMPYLAPAAVADRLQQLARCCDAVQRAPTELKTSVNLGFYMHADGGTPKTPPPGPMTEGSLVGSPAQVIDRIGEYRDSGIGGINIAFRPPIDWDAFESFIEDVMPAFAKT